MGKIFYRLYLSSLKGRGSAYKDFRKKSTAIEAGRRFISKRMSRHETASIKIKKITPDIAYIYKRKKR